MKRRIIIPIILVLFIVALVAILSDEEKEALIPDVGSSFCDQVHRNDSISLSRELASLNDQMSAKTGAYVLEDGAGSMVYRAWLTEYAEESINIQYFIFSTDNVGLIACDYLVRAADRGVQVNILIDDIMVEADIQDVLTLDSHENINIKIYNPGSPGQKPVEQTEEIRP